jgi:hypothetical protein
MFTTASFTKVVIKLKIVVSAVVELSFEKFPCKGYSESSV